MAFKNYLEDENDKPYFTTNSLAYYYDKMEGFAEKVEGSAKALNLTKEEMEKRLTLYIEQNKNELDQRLAQWDGKLETFDSSVETLLSEWVNDGTLNHVIDTTLIDQKIAPVAAQFAETVKSDDNNIYFNPKRVKNAFTNEQMSTVKTQDIYNLYNAFVDDKYVTKTVLGKDQSNLFDVMKYEFTPKNFTKKIIISASMHGNGVGGDPRDVSLGLYYFLKQLMDNKNDNKHLNFIRNKVKLIIIPIVNPWGYDNASRFNSRGVDINRNSPYTWESYTDTSGTRPKGASPSSEMESQLLKQVLDTNTDADAYIDYHAWMNTGLTFGYEYADLANTETSKVAYNLADHLIRKHNIPKVQMSQQVLTNEPTFISYAYKTLGIPSGSPEFYVYVTDLSNRSEETWTRMVEWYGNFIHLFATENLKLNQSNTRKLINLQATASEIVGSSNTVLTKFETWSSNPFPFNPLTGEVTIPKGVKNIVLNAQVFFYFDSVTPEDMQISLFIQRNAGRTIGYPVSKNVIKLGGDSGDFREYVASVHSHPIGVNEGDKFRVIVFTSHKGGKLKTAITLDGEAHREATWFSVEEVKL